MLLFLTFIFCRRAHTLTVLFILTCALVYVTLLEETPQDTTYNTKRSVNAQAAESNHFRLLAWFSLIFLHSTHQHVFIADVLRFLKLLCNTLLSVNLFNRKVLEYGECMTEWSVFMLVFVRDGGAGLNRIFWSRQMRIKTLKLPGSQVFNLVRGFLQITYHPKCLYITGITLSSYESGQGVLFIPTLLNHRNKS